MKEEVSKSVTVTNIHIFFNQPCDDNSQHRTTE